MKTSLTDIQQFFREEDIEGLIADGAPDDEYDSEAEDIVAAMAKLSPDNIDEPHVVSIIALVWAQSFHRDENEIAARMDAFRRIATRILE